MVSNCIICGHNFFTTQGESCGPRNSSPAVNQKSLTTILCSFKRSTPNNIVSFFVTKFRLEEKNILTKYYRKSRFFACLAPQKPYNFNIFCRFFFRYLCSMVNKSFYQKNHFFKISNWTTNIVMLVNVEQT